MIDTSLHIKPIHIHIAQRAAKKRPGVNSCPSIIVTVILLLSDTNIIRYGNHESNVKIIWRLVLIWQYIHTLRSNSYGIRVNNSSRCINRSTNITAWISLLYITDWQWWSRHVSICKSWITTNIKNAVVF